MSPATSGLRKGAWTEEEDILLRDCIAKYGEGKWHLVPIRAGLSRCRKSCRLRWLNYLRPDIKRGDFSSDEVDLIIRLHKLLGNRWSLIAGRLPGRTANDVKNYWNTHLLKKMVAIRELEVGNIANKINSTAKTTRPITSTARNVTVKPRPRAFSKNGFWQMKSNAATTTVAPRTIQESRVKDSGTPPPTAVQIVKDSGNNFSKPCWWDNLFLNFESEATRRSYLDGGSGTLENGMTSLRPGELSNFQEVSKDGSRHYSQEGEFGSSFFSIDSEFWDFLP